MDCDLYRSPGYVQHGGVRRLGGDSLLAAGLLRVTGCVVLLVLAAGFAVVRAQPARPRPAPATSLAISTVMAMRTRR